MADLVETNEFPAGIYQLETSDPVLGGAPNEATKAGVDNIPHQQLAKRTRWLKVRVDALLQLVVAASTAMAGIVRLSNETDSTSETLAATPKAVKTVADSIAEKAQEVVDENKQTNLLDDTTGRLLVTGAHGLGAAPPYAANLNTERTTGWRRYDATTANRPAGVGTAGIMQVMAVSDTRVVQILWPVNGQVGAAAVMRFSHDGGWGAWTDLVTGTFTGTLGGNGWRRLPDGMILQWGRSTLNVGDATGEVTVSFPLTWPNACLAVVASDISNAFNKSACSAVPLSNSQLQLTWARVFGSNHQGTRWFAIGY